MSKTYDGHGRLKTEHYPEQNTAAVTTYNYNADDRITSVVDARGVTTAYTYNNLGSVEQINYTVPSPLPPNEPVITPSAPVSFTYDAIGNQISRTDGFGTLTFEYDQLSRLTGETRSFSGPNVSPMPFAPLPNNSFNIAYEYDLASKVKSVTDPFGAGINYHPDKVGRLSRVTGNGFAGISIYIDSIKYRAWGGLKEVLAANAIRSTFTYNNRLLVETELIQGDDPHAVPTSKQYRYTADGNVKFSDDLTFQQDSDASYRYDHVGRLIAASSGSWARGEPEAPPINRTLYKYSFGYNAWGDVITENKAANFQQGQGNVPSTNYTYTNGRLTGSINGNGTTSVSSFDADGRLANAQVFSGTNLQYTRQYKYGADGLLSSVAETNSFQQLRWTDGTGTVAKERFLAYNPETQTYVEQGEMYYIRSSVFGGGVLTEVGKDGRKGRGYVYGLGKVIATQELNWIDDQSHPWVVWEYRDMLRSRYQINTVGSSGIGNTYELDPLGAVVRTFYDEETQPEDPYWLYPRMGGADDDADGMNCTIDGVTSYCSSAVRLLSLGLAIQCPYSSCGPVPVYDPVGRRHVLVQFNAQNYLEGGDGYPLGSRGSPPTLQRPTPEQRSAARAQAARNPVDVEQDRIPRDPIMAGANRQTQQGPRIDPGLPSNIRKLVNDLAQKKDCAAILDKFAERLRNRKGDNLDKVGKGKTFIESVFDNLKGIVISNRGAGSGARTDGDYIWVRDYNLPTLSQAHQNAAYSKYILQELVHNFRSGNSTFRDATLDRVARDILAGMDRTVANKIKNDFAAMAGKDPTDGYLAHYLINQYCQYSQQEVDNGQPTE